MGGQGCAAVRVARDAHDIAALRAAAAHVRADAHDAIDRRRLVAHARHVIEDRGVAVDAQRPHVAAAGAGDRGAAHRLAGALDGAADGVVLLAVVVGVAGAHDGRQPRVDAADAGALEDDRRAADGRQLVEGVSSRRDVLNAQVVGVRHDDRDGGVGGLPAGRHAHVHRVPAKRR